MSNGKKRGIGLSLLAVIVLGGAVSVFLFWGPPRLLAKSETPLFCASCHVMEEQHQAWSNTGAHRREMCVDCHLPNHNRVAHYTWKSISGVKDTLVFYSGRVPERITITDQGKAMVQSNCIRCHENTVMHIDQERFCWDCHRRLAHRNSGAIQTL